MADSNSKRIRHRRILKNYYKDVKFEGQINLDWNKIPEKRSRYTKTSVLEKYPKASRTAATTTVTVTAAATSTVAATTITAATSTEATTSTVTAAATTITSIEDAHLGKDEGVSGELVFETSVQDQLQLYAFTLISNKGFVYFDQQLTACALLDWNNDLKILKNDHPVLIYKVSGFGFVCTCNPERHDFINRVSSCVSNDIDNLYDRCLHIKALESISDSFLKYHGIEDAETHGSAKYSYMDHDYMKGSMESVEQKVKSVQKLEWAMKDTFIINIPSLDLPYAIIGTMYGKIQCLSCRTSCCHVRHIETWSNNINLLDNDDGMDLFQLLESVSKGGCTRNKTYSLKCHSTAPVPYCLTSGIKEALTKDPSSFFIEEDGILQVIPTLYVCSCGGEIAEELSSFKDQSLLLTRYRVIPVQCYFRTCMSCNKLHAFDGKDECLLNMGKFLLHYEVLRDYMYQFVNSRCTLTAFYNIWRDHQIDAGNDHFENIFHYSHFRWSWYSFLNLLDIDYSKSYICPHPECGTMPQILLFDGTTLAFQRSALPVQIDTGNKNSEAISGRYKERVFISDRKTRNFLRSFAKEESTSGEEYNFLQNMCRQHIPCLYKILPQVNEGENFKDAVYTCPHEYKELILLLTCDSPMSATIHFSDIHLVEEIIKLKGVTKEILKNLQQKIPILYRILAGFDTIPPPLFDIFRLMVVKAKAPFAGVDSCRPKDLPADEPLYACYPSLPCVRGRGNFMADEKRSEGNCRKRGTRHPTLLPGIFTVFCPHGICYGFQLMPTPESPNVPFTFLRTRFQSPPKTVIYDNACNLYEYCLNRDPIYFKDVHFLVDGLHWPNHTRCAVGYEALGYPRFKDLNTQVVEQNNSKLKKLKSSLSYMKPENFMSMLRLFLFHSNNQVKKRLQSRDGMRCGEN